MDDFYHQSSGFSAQFDERSIYRAILDVSNEDYRVFSTDN